MYFAPCGTGDAARGTRNWMYLKVGAGYRENDCDHVVPSY